MEPRNLIRSRCCRCAPSASSRFDEGFDADQKKAAKEVKKSCNLNLAAAQLKLGNAVEARKAADKVRFAQCWYTPCRYHNCKCWYPRLEGVCAVLVFTVSLGPVAVGVVIRASSSAGRYG